MIAFVPILLCGFYVGASGKPLHAEASQVVLARSGTRTVMTLEMQVRATDEAFALVVPVRGTVTSAALLLPGAVDPSGTLDALDAPRLVTYVEHDPCADAVPARAPEPAPPPVGLVEPATAATSPVRILGAAESADLERWLDDAGYTLPPGAAPKLRPYVDGGWQFVVVPLDASTASLPVQIVFDSDELRLPARVGLLSSPGTQDLIVHVLAATRVQAANHPNVFVETNLDLPASAASTFAAHYAALFDRARADGAVVTEHAGPIGDLVLTRLHARYGSELTDDLVLEPADPVAGGREAPGPAGALDTGARLAEANAFGARYAIRRAWTGPIRCEDPRPTRWVEAPGAVLAFDLAAAPRARLDDERAPTGRVSSETRTGGCGAAPAPGGGALVLLALMLLRRRS